MIPYSKVLIWNLLAKIYADAKFRSIISFIYTVFKIKNMSSKFDPYGIAINNISYTFVILHFSHLYDIPVCVCVHVCVCVCVCVSLTCVVVYRNTFACIC